MQIADSQPEMIASRFSNFTPSLQLAVAPRVATAWVEQDPEAAADWSLSLQGSPAESEATNGVVSRWVRNDPDAATQWAINLPRGAVRDNALSLLIVDSTGTDLDVLSILDEIESNDMRLYATLLTAGRLSSTQPEVARELFETMIDDPNPQYRDYARDSLERLRSVP